MSTPAMHGSVPGSGRGKLTSDVARVAAEIRNGGRVEAVGLGSLRGYQPSYMEIDGAPVPIPCSLRGEAVGVRVERANGEVALYVTPTMERARILLSEARKAAAA